MLSRQLLPPVLATLTFAASSFVADGYVTLDYDSAGNSTTTTATETISSSTAYDVTSDATTMSQASGNVMITGATSAGALMPLRAQFAYSARTATVFTVTALNAGLPTTLSIGASASTALQDLDGNTVASFSGSAATYTNNTTALDKTALAVSGSTLTLTFNEPLLGGQTPQTGDFTVLVNGGSRSVSSVGAISAGAISFTLTLASPIRFGDTVTLAYTQNGTAGNRVKSASGLDTQATWTATSVTNNTANAAPDTPTFVSPAAAAGVNSTTPTLTANYTDGDTQDTGKLTFEVCSNSDCSSSLGTFDSTVTTLAGSGANGSAPVPGGFALASGTTYHWRVQGVDAAALPSSFTATRSFTVDTANPTQTLSLRSQTGGGSFYDSGNSIVFYKGSATGSFKLRTVVSDGGTGPAKADFPALAGAGGTSWAHSAETDVTTPGGGTYDSANAFDWTATETSTTVTEAVKGYDAAGNSVTTTVTLKND